MHIHRRNNKARCISNQLQNLPLNLSFILRTRALCPNIINTKADRAFINSVRGVYCSATVSSSEVIDIICQGLKTLLLWSQFTHFINLFICEEKSVFSFPWSKGKTVPVTVANLYKKDLQVGS